MQGELRSFDDFSGPQNIGHLFITFKSNLFQKNYNKRIKDNIKTIKKLPKIRGVKEINILEKINFIDIKKNKKNIFINKNIKIDINKLLK